ncbi:MAG: hypothetical protein ACLSVD_17220 [Eggerthellaceae bacterium]
MVLFDETVMETSASARRYRRRGVGGGAGDNYDNVCALPVPDASGRTARAFPAASSSVSIAHF